MEFILFRIEAKIDFCIKKIYVASYSHQTLDIQKSEASDKRLNSCPGITKIEKSSISNRGIRLIHGGSLLISQLGVTRTGLNKS